LNPNTQLTPAQKPGHLLLGELKLAPAEEWLDQDLSWRFLRLSAGAAYWLDPARPRAVNEGEMVIVAPGIKSVIRASQLNQVVLHGFTFVPELLCGLFTLAERHFIDNAQREAVQPVRFLPSTHHLTRHLAGYLAEHQASPPLTGRVVLLGLVVAFFSEQMPGPDPPLLHHLPTQQRFNEIISVMPELEFIQYTPEQLSALCDCSTRHFNRLFHLQFGTSPRARQTELRLLRARSLLENTALHVNQVALECGYRSLSLFNSLFKRRFGMSPSLWRQQSAPTGQLNGQSPLPQSASGAPRDLNGRHGTESTNPPGPLSASSQPDDTFQTRPPSPSRI
jgi:AraC-like DNA-binding protein